MTFHTISFHFITCMGSIPMCIRINKIDGFINIQAEKSGITGSNNHSFARIRIDSYNSLHTETTLAFDDVIILIKSVVNE